MDGNHFDQIAQEILKQQQLMKNLEAENNELRRQIADLHSGRGIFVDIHGTRFALRDDSSLMQANSLPLTSEVTASTPLATSPLNQSIMDEPTAEIPSQAQEQGIKEQVPQLNNEGEQKSLAGESTFLEEIMIAEFNSALSSPNAVWQDPTEKQPSKQQQKPEEPIDEKQKETLRRELMGSFLLE
jgi:hypothetical protein